MNNNEYLEKAQKRIDALVSGDEFELKDLFDPVDWKSHSAQERRSFGRYFSSNLSDGSIIGVKRKENDKKGSNKYVKE